jgi:hypothetical protein
VGYALRSTRLRFPEMTEPSDNLYPIAMVEDRYTGVYSGGTSLAIAKADLPYESQSRADFVLSDGPHRDDCTAAEFWSDPPIGSRLAIPCKKRLTDCGEPPLPRLASPELAANIPVGWVERSETHFFASRALGGFRYANATLNPPYEGFAELT